MRYGWAIKHTLWSSLPEQLVKGGEWRRVQFGLSDANSVPPESGIYALCAAPPGRARSVQPTHNDLFGVLFTALYIGRTRNLNQRFIQHCSHPKPEIELIRSAFQESLEFWFHRLNSKDVVAVEAQLIDCFGPPGNLKRGAISAKVLKSRPADSSWAITNRGVSP